MSLQDRTLQPTIWDSRRTWYGLIVLTLLLGIVWTLNSRVQDGTKPTASPPAPRTGFPAPDFTLATVDGQTVTLSELRGRPILINFWATWCPPCRAELPAIQATYERYADRGLVVLAVDMAEPPATVAAFAQELGLSFLIPLDQDGSVAEQYRVRAIPTSFFVDREGIVRSIFIGPMNEPIIEDRLRPLMGEAS